MRLLYYTMASFVPSHRHFGLRPAGAFHEFIPGKLNLESRIPRATAERLVAMGHKVTVTGEWSNASAPTVIEVANGVLQGGADPRRGRFIFGR